MSHPKFCRANIDHNYHVRNYEYDVGEEHVVDEDENVVDRSTVDSKDGDEDSDRRPTKKRRRAQENFLSSTTTTMNSAPSSDPSEARQQMDILLELQCSARDEFRGAEENLRRAKEAFEHATKALEEADTSVHNAAEELADALLAEPSRWNEMYQKLVEFTEKHGHCRVPRRTSEKVRQENPELVRLGQFVGKCRLGARRPVDHPERIEPYKVVALDRIGFIWEPHGDFWKKMYEELKKYHNEHGDCFVPRGRKALSKWCDDMSYQYKKFQAGDPTSVLTQERINMLNALGFVWTRCERVWNERYEELVEFRSRHGHCFVSSHDDKYKKLCAWVSIQRANYRSFKAGGKTSLSEKRFKMLEDLDFVFEEPPDANFMEKIEALKKFKDDHGNCIVPRSYCYHPALSEWVCSIRADYVLWKSGKKSNLTDTKLSLLNGIGFEWEVTEDMLKENPMVKTWDENFADFVHYTRINKEDFFDDDRGKQVEAWALEQKKQFLLFLEGKESSLTYERIGKLHAATYEFTSDGGIPEKFWEEMFVDLVSFNLKCGSYDLTRMDDGLMRWATQQLRQYANYKKGLPSSLTRERLEMLVAVGFLTSLPAKSWEENLSELMIHRKRHGTFNFAKSAQMSQLSKWAREQHKMFDKYSRGGGNTITAQRIKKLRRISFPLEDPKETKQEEKRAEMRLQYMKQVAFSLSYMAMATHEMAPSQGCTRPTSVVATQPSNITGPTSPFVSPHTLMNSLAPMAHPPFVHPFNPVLVRPQPWQIQAGGVVPSSQPPATSTPCTGAQAKAHVQKDKKSVEKESSKTVGKNVSKGDMDTGSKGDKMNENTYCPDSNNRKGPSNEPGCLI